MLSSLKRIIKKQFRKNVNQDIDPTEIFLDSQNLPEFDVHQFEGRMEKPITKRTMVSLGIVFLCIVIAFSLRLYTLEITRGEAYKEKSENNRLQHVPLLSERGVILDRFGSKLVTNTPPPIGSEFAMRKYINETGFAHLLGYVKYPAKDTSGFYYRNDFEGVAGVEKFFDSQLKGESGLRIVETNALGKVESESVLTPPHDGEALTLSIDKDVQHHMYEAIATLAEKVGFTGGSGLMMDVHTGEIIAMASYPEFDPNIISEGSNGEEIRSYLTDKRNVFLNRTLAGLYTPGSVVKPYMALAALTEKTIDPLKIFNTTGSISIQNEYDPTKKTVFNDWQNQGPVDMRKAIAMSSNVYFFIVGGGYEGQAGLGISRIEKYMNLFGFGKTIEAPFFTGPAGTIPSPEWKKTNFKGETWRIGDTYNTSIGQYGFQATPIQIVRAVASIANRGELLTPTILKSEDGKPVGGVTLPVANESYSVVQEGMRRGALEGTAKALNLSFVDIAAKTGTAELDSGKKYVNSLVTGFFPYQNPRYAFVFVMEKGPRANIYGAVGAARDLFEWMNINKPEYLK